MLYVSYTSIELEKQINKKENPNSLGTSNAADQERWREKGMRRMFRNQYLRGQ